MFTRPKPGEDEDEILKLHEKFVRDKSSQPSVSVINKRKIEHGSEPEAVADAQDIPPKRPHSKFAARRDKTRRNEDSQPSMALQGNVLGEIREKHVGADVVFPPMICTQKGFPEPFIRDKTLTGKGRSIFAQQVGGQSRAESIVDAEMGPPQVTGDLSNTFGDRSFVVSGPESARIHKENMDKLNNMSSEEIQLEQSKLTASLDPKLLSYLKSRRQTHPKMDVDHVKPGDLQKNSEQLSTACPRVTEMACSSAPTITVPVIVEGVLPLAEEANKWLHMDVVEKEKLQWMGEISPAPPIPSDQPYAARFDFEGMLLPYSDDQLDVTRGLHHHGEEPERPGYTLQELYQLSRSSVMQQRILALHTMANILDKTKAGQYDECLQETLLTQLLDSEVFLLLRFSLDDNTETVLTATLLALRSLLCSQPDEVCLDWAFGCAGFLRQPSLGVPQDVRPGEEEELRQTEAELRDHQTLRLDLVRGALRTDLVPRIRYILEVLHPGPKCVIAALEILMRLTRHSLDSTLAVTCCPRLMTIIIANFVPRDWGAIVGDKRPEEMVSAYGVPLVAALKLLRVIACRSRSLASDLVHKYNIVDALINYISIDPRECSLPQQEALRLSLESLYLWQTLLAYNLATQQFTDMYPVLMRLLQFHLAATSTSDGASMFGHEHGTALVSLLERAVLTARAQDSCPDRSLPRTLGFTHIQSFVAPLEMCLKKWLTQLGSAQEMMFSALKLTGVTLNCLASCYLSHRAQPGVDAVSQLETLESLCSTQLLTFLQSANFQRAASAVNSSSCLLFQGSPGTGRDPATLPSLGALMWGGHQLSPVLQPTSPLPLLQGLANFLVTAHSLHKGLSSQCANTFLGNAPLLDYVSRVSQQATAHLANHWFTRLEVTVLADVLRLACLQNSPQIVLFHHLALKLVTLIQTDEKVLLKDILKQIVFNRHFFKDSSSLAHDLSTMQLKEGLVSASTLLPAASRQGLLQDAIDNLSGLWNCYEGVLGLSSVQASSSLNVSSLTATERGLEPSLPIDWYYLPILQLYNKGLSAEGCDAERTTLVTRALQWGLLLEWLRPASIAGVNLADRFCRLATVFLAGSDLFLEPQVHALLAAGLAQLMKQNHRLSFPAEFYNLYTQLLEQFAAVSYGDPLFGHFVLVPLQQRHSPSLRKLVWSEQAAILRVLRTPVEQLMFPMSELLEPCETEPSLLASYLRCLATFDLRECWSPVLYQVAIHHVATFIHQYQDTGVAQRLRTSIDRIPNKELRSLLLEYSGPAAGD